MDVALFRCCFLRRAATWWTSDGSGGQDQEIRAALDQHCAASDANDFETEHRFITRAYVVPIWVALIRGIFLLSAVALKGIFGQN